MVPSLTGLMQSWFLVKLLLQTHHVLRFSLCCAFFFFFPLIVVSCSCERDQSQECLLLPE